jgi:penicillin-binding protein 2
MLRPRFLSLLALSSALLAQETPRVASNTKAGAPKLAPSWETQQQAGTSILTIPAPRGQIVDRYGAPLAQTRISYNLCIAFPTPLSFNDAEVRTFCERRIAAAEALLARSIPWTVEQAQKHYKNRGLLPLVIAIDLKASEIEALKKANPEGLALQATYQRHYPNGRLAAHVIGYAGRAGRILDGPMQPNEPLWPGAEGREGLEQSFDDQLQGRLGQFAITTDASGRRVSEQVLQPPQPGYNVVTTIDTRIQKLCEQALERGCKRGAMVVVDPRNGDVLAMASWPTFNPNSFIPFISAEEFKALQDDPNIPLFPRAFRAAYPPGSVFKIFSGIAALQSGKLDPGDTFPCPPSLRIGGLTFGNARRGHQGSLTFSEALTQSCNTWFYQVGMKIGSATMSDYAMRFGLGQRTGIPLNAEASGLIPNDEYMMRVHKRAMLGGDLANFAIGQGDVTATPLQLAMAVGAAGNGGTLYAARLVNQVQSIDGQIVTAYEVRQRSRVDFDKEVFKSLQRGMTGVVESRAGTAPVLRISGLKVGGKTGTAQWGPKNKERTAAWFAGVAPIENPKYAFAALYESDVRNADSSHGGDTAAPMLARVLRELAKDEKAEAEKQKKAKAKKKSDDDEPTEDGEEKDRPAKKERDEPR